MRVTSRMIAGTAVTVVVVASAWVAIANETSKDAETTPNTGSRSGLRHRHRHPPRRRQPRLGPLPQAQRSRAQRCWERDDREGAVRQLSPAWVEAQPFMDLEATPGDLDLRLWADRYLSNPNQWSTPMGAFCWGYFELGRLTALASSRIFLDTLVIPRSGRGTRP